MSGLSAKEKFAIGQLALGLLSMAVCRRREERAKEGRRYFAESIHEVIRLFPDGAAVPR